VEKEGELGARLAGEMAASSAPLNNSAASAYVDRVVREFGGADSRFPVSICGDGSEGRSAPGARGVPGGYIYVPTGMFKAAQSESEFSGLLAHAMVEVAQRAATRMLTRQEINQITVRPLATMDGWQGDAVRKGMGGAIPQGMQQFRRQLKMASDAMAVRIMATAGYDPSGLAQFVARSGKDDGFPGWDGFQQRRLEALRRAPRR
jgi:predicted Zn-dependent protease